MKRPNFPLEAAVSVTDKHIIPRLFGVVQRAARNFCGVKTLDAASPGVCILSGAAAAFQSMPMSPHPERARQAVVPQ
jgi:hypothetical protein